MIELPIGVIGIETRFRPGTSPTENGMITGLPTVKSESLRSWPTFPWPSRATTFRRHSGLSIPVGGAHQNAPSFGSPEDSSVHVGFVESDVK